MKLAILALCRLEKNVIIISSKKMYSFRIKEDLNFIKIQFLKNVSIVE
jgi:hypothetical protein